MEHEGTLHLFPISASKVEACKNMLIFASIL